MQLLGFGLHAPLWALLGGPVLLGLVALYTIRSQPQHRKLPSLRLWREVLRRKRPNSLLSRYRNSLFLLLQLLVLGAGFLAVMRPYRSSDTSGEILLAVDLSASMATLDGRMDQAREKLNRILDGLDPGARAALVPLGPLPLAGVEMTRDLGSLRAALQALRPQPGPALSPAQVLERLAARRTPGTHLVHLVADSYAPEDFPGGLPGSRVQLHHVGSSRENVGITRLDVRPEGDAYQVAALLRNYAAVPAEVVVQLVGQAPRDSAREILAAEGGERMVLFSGVQPEDGVLGVGLRVARGPRDRLDLDDRAWSAPRRGSVRVLLVSAAPADLQRALELEMAVKVTHVLPTQLPSPEDLAGYDLVVSDRHWSPELAEHPLLLFHPRKATPFSAGRLLTDPSLGQLDRTHPVNRYLSLRDVSFGEAMDLDLVEDARTVVDAASGPLVLVRETGGERQVLCAFDLGETDLPRRVGFPIFLTNAVRWLLANDSKLKGQFRVGQPLALRGPGPFVLRDPGGEETTLESSSGGSLPFDRLGVYQLRRGKRRPEAYPVNLLSPEESRISPRGAGTHHLGEVERDASGRGQRELWKLLLVASLVGLTLEWTLLSLRGGAS